MSLSGRGGTTCKKQITMGYYDVEKPKAAPDQSVAFTFQLLFPKKWQ